MASSDFTSVVFFVMRARCFRLISNDVLSIPPNNTTFARISARAGNASCLSLRFRSNVISEILVNIAESHQGFMR